MLPTIVLANLSPSGPAARCGQLNIGDQVRVKSRSLPSIFFLHHNVFIFHSDHRHQRHIAGRPPAFNLSELHQGAYWCHMHLWTNMEPLLFGMMRKMNGYLSSRPLSRVPLEKVVIARTRGECSDSIAGKLTARSRRPSSPPLLPCQTISFINATKHLSVAEHQEQDGRQAHRRLVRARRRSQDQEAGHKVSAGILRAERRGEFQCTSPFQSVTLWSLLQILRFRETPSCLSCKKVLPHSP